MFRHAWWLAPLIGIIGLLSYFLFFYQFPVLRDTALLNVAIVVFAAVLGVLGLFRRWAYSITSRKFAFLGGALVAVGCMALLLSYVFWTSYQLPDGEATWEADSAPALSLRSTAGETVAVGSGVGQRQLISFYRGYW